MLLIFHISDRNKTCPASHPSGNQVDGLPLVAHTGVESPAGRPIQGFALCRASVCEGHGRLKGIGVSGASTSQRRWRLQGICFSGP